MEDLYVQEDSAVARADELVSSHFQRSEFSCPHCGVALVRPRLLIALERLRAIIKTPITVVSGYRCPPHNQAVGGASDSQHMYASAVDVHRGTCTLREAIDSGFVGIGTKGGMPVHLDVRDGLAARWTYDEQSGT